MADRCGGCRRSDLLDITLERRNAAICGYTDADLDATFAGELPGLDRDEIRSWYGGYRWASDEEIYNPLGILRLFRERRFDGSWFDAAAPAFLIDMLMERGVDPDALDDRICDGQMLSVFDPDNVVMETLLFRAAASRSPARRISGARPSIGWGIRTGRCAGGWVTGCAPGRSTRRSRPGGSAVDGRVATSNGAARRAAGAPPPHSVMPTPRNTRRSRGDADRNRPRSRACSGEAAVVGIGGRTRRSCTTRCGPGGRRRANWPSRARSSARPASTTF